MNLAVVFEPIVESSFPPGYYYAHIPSLGLTTHGEGLEGARAAAVDLVVLWLEEKRAAGEPVQAPPESLFSTLSIPSDAVQSS
jgi:predicted RNase H-like HicB family nuclease